MSQRTADGYRKFVYQGPDMLKLQLERDESEETIAHYPIGAGLEAMRRETSSFYHYNHLGTALALTGADEAVTDTYRHDAWGVLLERTGSTLNPHTYVGRERYYRMPNAEMHHLGFRDYAQGLGRFMTVDPLSPEELMTPQILLKGFAELTLVRDFVYAANGPVFWVDPEGLWPWKWPPRWWPWPRRPKPTPKPTPKPQPTPLPQPLSPPSRQTVRDIRDALRTDCGSITPQACNSYWCSNCCDTLFTHLGDMFAVLLVVGAITKDTLMMIGPGINIGDMALQCQNACDDACGEQSSGRAGVQACFDELGISIAYSSLLNGVLEYLKLGLP